MNSGSEGEKFPRSRSNNRGNLMITVVIILTGIVLVTSLDGTEK